MFQAHSSSADPYPQINDDLAGAPKHIINVFSHVIYLNAVKLCVMTINEKPWTRPKEVCWALEYYKTTKAADIVKHLCCRENYAHKWQLTELVSEMNFMGCPRDSRKDGYYINEEGMYELGFGSKQPKAKHFRKHCCNVMFPRI